MSIPSRCCVCLVTYGTQRPSENKETRCASYMALQCGSVVCHNCVPKMNACHIHRTTSCFDHVFKIGMNTLDSHGKAISIPLDMCKICMCEGKKMVVFCEQDYCVQNYRVSSTDSDEDAEELDNVPHVTEIQYQSVVTCIDCFDSLFKDVAISHAQLISI